jgi:peptide/nickel transport system substrate-binding protein
MMPLPPQPFVERPRSSRRAFLRGALALAGASSVASLLAACSQTPQATPSGTVPPAQGGTVTAAAVGTTGAAKSGGSLTFAQNQPIKKADSVDAQTYPAAYEANFTIFSNLVTFGPDLQIVPDLAEKWETSPEGTVWTFHLRQGVTFHDGSQFNAAAVQAHIKRIQDPKTASPNANQWQHITDAKVIDDATVQLTTAKPFGPMLNYLAHGSGGIPSPAAIDKYGDQFGQHPTGTGRYKLDSFTPGSDLILTRNDAYFGGRPPLDRIRFRPVPEVGSRVAALEASEADVINDVPPEEAQRLQKSKGIQVLRKPGLRTFWMEFNLNLDMFKDKQVRQALNYAVDKEAIVKSLFLGFASVLDSPAAATIQGYTSVGRYAYDPQRANQLLDGAGWTKGPDGIRQKDGRKLQFTINTAEGEYPKDVQYVEAVQANLKAVGCDPQIWKVEAASRWSYLRLAPSEAKGEMISFGFNPSNGDLGYHLNAVFHSNKDRSKAPDVWNLMWYENNQVDSLLDQAQTTADQAKRFEMLGQAQKLIWEDAPVIFLHAPDLLTGIRDATRDVVVWPTVFTVVRGASKG